MGFDQELERIRKNRVARYYDDVVSGCVGLLNQALTPHQAVIVHEMIGSTYSRMGHRYFGRAKQHLIEAINCAQHSDEDTVFALSSLARLLLIQNNVWEAQMFLDIAIHRLTRLGKDPRRLRLHASVESLKGALWAHEGRYGDALHCLIRAESILQEHPDDVRHLRNLRRLAYTYAKSGDMARARVCANATIELASTIYEVGDPKSLLIGKRIKLATYLPGPIRWFSLRSIRAQAGL